LAHSAISRKVTTTPGHARIKICGGGTQQQQQQQQVAVQLALVIAKMVSSPAPLLQLLLPLSLPGSITTLPVPSFCTAGAAPALWLLPLTAELLLLLLLPPS
jgi:hypothetical protein